jgi:YhcH/YjgK/YiaL family protein
MIIDTIKNAYKYDNVHPLFRKAFDYIRNMDLKNCPEGKSEIAEGLKSIVSNAPGKTKETSLAKFECHDQHIDIQLCIAGHESIGWKPRENCKLPNGDYNEEKDVRYFSDAPDTFFELTGGQFAIFFPEDVHAPMIGVEGIKDEMIKKMVIKVKI